MNHALVRHNGRFSGSPSSTLSSLVSHLSRTSTTPRLLLNSSLCSFPKYPTRRSFVNVYQSIPLPRYGSSSLYSRKESMIEKKQFPCICRIFFQVFLGNIKSYCFTYSCLFSLPTCSWLMHCTHWNPSVRLSVHNGVNGMVQLILLCCKIVHQHSILKYSPLLSISSFHQSTCQVQST